MDPIKNPFSPGAGSPPPWLVGRDPILVQADILLGRVKQGKSEKSMLLTGLRGVGKTVLLKELERRARPAGYLTIEIEASEGNALGALLSTHLRALLYALDRMAGAKDALKRAMGALRGFVGALKLSMHDVSLGLDIEPAKGVADSGDLETDLPNLFVAVAEAAADRQQGVAILLDEIQYFNQKDLGALIMAMHKVQQKQLPFVLLGAGLPILPALAGESKSYAERLFTFPDIGALAPDDVEKALREPARAAGADFEPAAAAEVFRQTKGYPYFVQEWGYQSWNVAAADAIREADVRAASANVVPRLDQNFFRVRFDRLTAGQRKFLRAMAELGPLAQRTAEVAEMLGVKITALGPVRAKLIKMGMVYSPAHGELAFTVPLFDEFMRRAMPDFTP